MTNSDNLNFVYKAIDDTCNTIRALDVKIYYIFVTMGLVFGLIGVTFDKILQFYNQYKYIPIIDGSLLLLIIVYGTMTARAIWYGYRTLAPENNPLEHIDYGDIKPNQLWYLTNNEKGKISIPLDEYYKKISCLGINDLLLSASFELMKLSFMRNTKLNYVNKSIFNFMVSLFSFIIILAFVFIYNFIIV
ncbi:hypothetical protein AB8U03_04305 [Clostridium sp. Mt-5]|uniref:Uncharacterized protein n=1 Tax=Clostridium moutaii TaxID=3240932 RepID=A0ABV4BMX6_9CLOT